MKADLGTHTQEDYRGYSLRVFRGTGSTLIYHNGHMIDAVTLKQKGRCRTTKDAAKDLIDAWVEGGR